VQYVLVLSAPQPAQSPLRLVRGAPFGAGDPQDLPGARSEVGL